MIGCLLLVLGFESSSALGAAYGVAATGTMTITTVLFYVIARQRWHWSALRAGALAGAFLTIDLAFFGANIVKIAEGGWVPLAIGGAVFLLMNSWHRGTELLRGFLAQAAVPMNRFLEEVERAQPPRVHGTAIFLTPDVDGAPLVLQRHLRHNKALHEEVILLSIVTEEIPEAEHDKRVTTEALPQGFHRVRAYYGFMERPDVQEIVAICRDLGLKAEAEETTYYLGRAELLSTGPGSGSAPRESRTNRRRRAHGSKGAVDPSTPLVLWGYRKRLAYGGNDVRDAVGLPEDDLDDAGCSHRRFERLLVGGREHPRRRFERVGLLQEPKKVPVAFVRAR